MILVAAEDAVADAVAVGIVATILWPRNAAFDAKKKCQSSCDSVPTCDKWPCPPQLYTTIDAASTTHEPSSAWTMSW